MRSEGRSQSWTLYRYIAAETAFSFFISFLFFFFIFFINQLLLMAEEILSKRVPMFQVALLILYSLPAIIAMAAPFASLVGTLMAIGRISSDNEVLVMRTSGLAYWTIFVPAILVGAAVSVVSFFANDVLLPAGTLEFGKLYRRMLLSTPAIELESNSVKRFKDTVLVTGEVGDRSIKELLIFDRTSAGERRLIVASNARLKEGTHASLSLDLTDAFVHTAKENAKGDYDYAVAEHILYSISEKDIVQSIGNPGPREMSSMDVLADIRKKEKAVSLKIEERRKKAFEAGLFLEAALRAGPADSRWNERAAHSGRLVQEVSAMQELARDRNLRVYRLEYYKKFSIPFGALSFVFLATPLGLFARKSGQSVGFGVGLIIAILYWALLIGGQTMGVRLGYSPFWAMWLPNVAAVSIGAFLWLGRVFR
ncbi:MAG: permease [Treponema sp. GWB1_62_6]|nr:MAG: permease [Treponema sp. GWC1_61_84]OHE69208.1 MAG: permease [Treponema sp. GWB1_62_6]OHE69392.1 MAG: permease [Treponema sp. RIFOXYC1_FULL_61_9]HCM28360.1 permease [Treponema sp.]